MTTYNLHGAKLKALRKRAKASQAAVADATTTEIRRRVESGQALGPMLGRRKGRSNDTPVISSAYLSAWERGGGINGPYLEVLCAALGNLLGRTVEQTEIAKA